MREVSVVAQALLLECSPKVVGASLLYRGGEKSEAERIKRHLKETTSLSYGTSLFAGCVYDGTASVFHYTSSKERNAFALVLDSKEKEDLFYVPNEHPLQQLLSGGEFFHGRSLLCVPFEEGVHVAGIWLEESKEFLHTGIPLEEYRVRLSEVYKTSLVTLDSE